MTVKEVMGNKKKSKGEDCSDKDADDKDKKKKVAGSAFWKMFKKDK